MTNPVPIELQMKLAEWRKKQQDGTLSLDEMKAAVVALRQGRVAAASASAVVKRKTAAKVIPSADDLLNELDGL
jgi:hypothetical protein